MKHNFYKKTITSRTKFLPVKKVSDNFWKTNLMKVLLAMYEQEATWALPYWEAYGVCGMDKEKIEQEFALFQKEVEKQRREKALDEMTALSQNMGFFPKTP